MAGTEKPRFERRLELSFQRLRVRDGPTLVVDTIRAGLLFEDEHHPCWVVPRAELQIELSPPHKDDARDGEWRSVALGGEQANRFAVRVWQSPPDDLPALADLAALAPNAGDQWLEEEQLVTGYPRNPYHRIDTLASARHVEVQIGGEPIAVTSRPTLLLETGIGPRWYLPPGDVSWERLRQVHGTTHCQYKGDARYWEVIDRGVRAWSYPAPYAEAAAISGLVAFSPRDLGVEIHVDGEPSQRL